MRIRRKSQLQSRLHFLPVAIGKAANRAYILLNRRGCEKPEHQWLVQPSGGPILNEVIKRRHGLGNLAGQQ
jgi:hypothetical protein